MNEATQDARREAAPAARCPACRARETRRSWRIAAHAFLRCRRCGSTFLREPPPEAEAKLLYADDAYFRNPRYDDARPGTARGYRDYVDDRAFIEAKFDAVLEQIERHRAPGDLLDVGAGPGLLVGRAVARGWRASGLDINPWAVAFARDVVGADVRPGTIEEAALDDSSYDAVTLMDLIEHLAEPDALLAQCRRIVRPGGVLAVLTPDAGSPISRALGSRWPELQRAPEHVVLYSVRGLASLLARHGFETIGWHSIGKESSLRTLVADVAPIAPTMLGAAGRALEGLDAAERSITLDPHTKFCLYARREGPPFELAPTRQPRLRATRRHTDVDENIHEDLGRLATAGRLCDWMFDQFRPLVRGRVAEIGAGIGTFSGRLLDAGAAELLLIEPDRACLADLHVRFGHDPRVRLVAETLPGSKTMAAEAGSLDFVLCQNVLEHIEDDEGAMGELAAALTPRGSLGLLVPAQPWLYGAADDRYGHYRRYTSDRLRALAAAAGLEIDRLYPFNTLGIAGWLGANRRRASAINDRTLAAYEALLRVWRPVEDRLRPPVGLSLILHARRAP